MIPSRLSLGKWQSSGRMRGQPMPGDFLSPADPDPFLIQQVVEKARQGPGPGGMTADARVKTDAH